MTNILYLVASPNGDRSLSAMLASQLVEALVSAHPDATVVTRDPAETAPPHVGVDFATGIRQKPDDRGPAQARAPATADMLIGIGDVRVLKLEGLNRGPDAAAAAIQAARGEFPQLLERAA